MLGDKTLQIRNLVESDNVRPCLNDFMTLYKLAAKHLINLEYGNKKTDLKDAKLTIAEMKKKIEAFEERLRKEVTEEVFCEAAKKNKNYKGNADSLIKYRANQ